jgi:hypothetical protein
MKARGFVISRDTGDPAAGVGVVAKGSSNGVASTLDVLTSDEAGYVSFDLDGSADGARSERIWLEVTGDPGVKVTLVEKGKNVAGDRPFVVEVEQAPDRQERPPENRPAVESPDIRDWELSPSSFTAPRKLTLGSGACAVPVRAEGPIHKVRLTQVVRRWQPAPGVGQAQPGMYTEATHQPGSMQHAFLDLAGGRSATDGEIALDPVAAEPEATAKTPIPCQLVEYEQTWTDLGHSLGSVVYSLPLAPCESVDLAVIEAARSDAITRTDAILSEESLLHDLRRDRNIEESVEAALQESQGGWSVTGGIGAVVGPVVGNIGASVSRSWGARDLTGRSLQDVHDRTVQATSAIRSLNTTVVVQATQTESHQLETRTLTNHNHCHALTVQYYEVLRRLKLETRHAGTRSGVMIPYSYLGFTKPAPTDADRTPAPGDLRLVNRLRPLLEARLLRPELKSNFEAVRRLLFFSKATPPPPPPADDSKTKPPPTTQDYDIRNVTLRLKRGPWGTSGSQQDPSVSFRIRLKDGSWAFFSQLGQHTREMWVFEPGLENDNSEDYLQWLDDYPAQLVNPVKRSALEALQIKWQQTEGFRPDWSLRGVQLRALSPSGEVTILKHETSATSKEELEEEFRDFEGKSAMKEFLIPPPPQPPPPPPADDKQPTPPASTKEQDEALAWELIAHLQDHAAHYTRLLLAEKEPAWFSAALDKALGNLGKVRESVDSVPVAMSGSYLVFALNGTGDPKATSEQPKEEIVSLPTRGLLGEAQLGSCNACEKRDVTRFWKWDETPCERPPQIGGVTPGFRGQTPTLEPTPLPPSVVQVTAPPAAPDPVGLAAALRTIGTAGLFRDMSASTQLATLLSGLSSGAIDLAKAREIAAKLSEKIERGDGATGLDGSDGVNRRSIDELMDLTGVAKELDKAGREMDWPEETRVGATSGLFQQAVAPAAGAAAKAGAVIGTLAMKAVEPAIKEMFSTPKGRYFHLVDGGALLEGYPNPADYLSEGEQVIPVFVRDVGGTRLTDGLDAELRITWQDCTLKPERIKKQDQGRARMLLAAVCKKNIMVTVTHWDIGYALTFAEVKPWKLYVPETSVMMTRSGVTGRVERQALHAEVLLGVSVTPSAALGPGGGPFANPALRIPLTPDKFTRYEIYSLTRWGENRITGHMLAAESTASSEYNL